MTGREHGREPALFVVIDYLRAETAQGRLVRPLDVAAHTSLRIPVRRAREILSGLVSDGVAERVAPFDTGKSERYRFTESSSPDREGADRG